MGKSAKTHINNNSTQQSQLIKKTAFSRQIDAKLAAIFRKERIRKQEMCIYVDSSEEQIKNQPNPAIPQQKPQEYSPELSLFFSSDSQLISEDQILCDSKIITNIEKLPQTNKQPILSTRSFQQVAEIDFQLYTSFLARSKIYGSLLIDEFGSIIWCDKMSHEILEGSLNNLSRIRLPNLFLLTQQNSFLQKMRSIDHFGKHTTLKWIIYSKNSKRRYIKVPLPPKPSNRDIFYRFLKCISVRVRAIAIQLSSYRDPYGFCNQQLVKTDRVTNCFFLQIRHTKRLPKIDGLNILGDPIIQKFMRTTELKSLRRRGLSGCAIKEGLRLKKQKNERNHGRSSQMDSAEEIENKRRGDIIHSNYQGLAQEETYKEIETFK